MRKDRRGGRTEGERWEEGKRKEKRRQEEGGEIERGIRGKGEEGWKEGGSGLYMIMGLHLVNAYLQAASCTFLFGSRIRFNSCGLTNT